MEEVFRIMHPKCVYTFLVLAASLFAQDTSSLSGALIDPSGAFVGGAQVKLIDPALGTIRYATSSETGLFTFGALKAGDYKLSANKDGFKELRVEKVTLSIRDVQNIRLQFELSSSPNSSVTVRPQVVEIPTDFSIGLALDGTAARDLPINGRDVGSMARFAPGVLLQPQPSEQLVANGLRGNTSYVTVDGVSASLGIASLRNGQGLSTGLAATGQSVNLITMESVGEFRVQSPAIDPEYGRSSGAQIAVSSRSGGNGFHGSVYGYFRNQRFNANDWFATKAGLDRAPMRQNLFGGSVSGRIIPNRTFFFANYEQNNLLSPVTSNLAVPDAAIRLSTTSGLRRFLNAFPMANGPSVGTNAALFRATYSNPSEVKAGNVRLDHVLRPDMNVFVRYATTPSSSTQRGTGLSSPSVLTSHSQENRTLTGAWTWARSEHSTNDLRVNYSDAALDSSSSMDDFGGAVPLTAESVLPIGVGANDGLFSVNVLGLGDYAFGAGTRNRLKQINVVNAYARSAGTHHYKMGIEFRRLAATFGQWPYSALLSFNGLTGGAGSLLSGQATNAIVSNNLPEQKPVVSNYSAYWGDTWKATDRATFTYGLRWDVNPAPGVRNGDKPYAIGDDGVPTQDKRLYKTGWFNLAPRLGLAYQMDDTANREMIFRAGVGAYYDNGYGAQVSTLGGAPYSSVRISTLPTFPLTATNLAAPALPASYPYGQLLTTSQVLNAPRVFQWQFGIERWFGSKNSLELAVVGSKATRLLQQVTEPYYNSGDAVLARYLSNDAASAYRALNVQYRRKFSANFQANIAYAWGRSTDTAANDVLLPGYLLVTGSKANSNFDVRHNFSAMGSYRLPGTENAWLKPLLNHWWADFAVTMRSAMPLNILTQTALANTTSTTQTHFYALVQPDYNGQPVWISDASAPGGKRLNSAAFTVPTTFAQGKLGRNAIRGFDLQQVDLKVRRDIQATEALRLQIGVEAYNLLNRANFANPTSTGTAYLGASNFGAATSLANAGNAYAGGGARMMQAMVRLEF